MKQYYPSAGEIVLLPCDRIISGPCRDEDAYYVIQPMNGYPETIQDIRIIDCELGVRK